MKKAKPIKTKKKARSESMANEKACIVCGKELSPGKRGGQRKFCSSKCGSAYHNHRNATKPWMPSGVAQCPQCGKEFKRAEKTKRECCSRRCAHKWNRREEVEQIQREAKEQKELGNPEDIREWILSLHSRGYSRGAIVEGLNLPLRTIRGWIERENKIGTFGEAHKVMKYRHSYGHAQTAAEWIAAFRKDTCNSVSSEDESAETGGRQINLVCGTRRGGKGADSLCIEIQGRLGMNPFSGDVFAFCGSERDRIRYIYWDGEGFRVVSRRRESGTYPWPSAHLGTTMLISANDFELLLCDDRKSAGNGRNVVTWDSLHFTGEIKTSFKDVNTQ